MLKVCKQRLLAQGHILKARVHLQMETMHMQKVAEHRQQQKILILRAAALKHLEIEAMLRVVGQMHQRTMLMQKE